VSPTASVAMATYNGGEFLDAQLSSLAAQTRLPDELVVCDDGSTDATVEIVERFAAHAPFEVRLHHNEANLGYGANFMQAAHLCRGELIAWCDQDDVWMPGKLARCIQEFDREPEAVLVVHSLRIGVGEDRSQLAVSGPLDRYRSRRSEERLLRRCPTFSARTAPLELNARGNVCVLSKRVLEIGDGLEQALPGVFEEFSGHDTWTSFLAPAIGKVVLLPDVLIDYRQHETQVAGQEAHRTVSTRIAESATRPQSALLQRLETRCTRAFFRASILTQLAAKLDLEAGLAGGAAPFRASLAERVVLRREIGFGRGASARAQMWQRHGEVLAREIELWRRAPTSGAAATRLVRNAAVGDYGPAAKGGLGWKVLLRDAWRLLKPAAHKSD
jgi:hypothetical protein